MIPDTTREKLIHAMKTFDEVHRDTMPNWEEKRNYVWAILHDKYLYPVKHIIGLATNSPRKNFYGGPPSNDYVRARGLEVVSLDKHVPSRVESITSDVLVDHSAHEDEENSMTLDQRTRDVIRVLTRAKVPLGQRMFYKAVLENGEKGLTFKNFSKRFFDGHHDQARGCLAALSVRTNNTPLETNKLKPGITIVVDSPETSFYMASDALKLAIQQLPDLERELNKPWDQVLRNTHYMSIAPPEGLDLRVRRSNRASSSDEVQPTNIFDYLSSKGLRFSRDQISAFLLALQSKRFVILTGISGTGKTQLALRIAQFLGQQDANDANDDTNGIEKDGVRAQYRPYTKKYARITLPSAISKDAHLPRSKEGWSSDEVTVHYGDGKRARLKVGNLHGQDARILFLKGVTKDWFFSEFEEGDDFILELRATLDDDDYDEIAILKPLVRRQVKNYEVIPVRPEWTDNRGLLGFYNPLTEEYHRTTFLSLMLRAQHELERASQLGTEPRPFIAILDEMNLARVEYYFSEFLSCMESEEPMTLHANASIAAGQTGDTVAIPTQIKVPDNLFFVGTVNMDETTHMFSPKVLDRAFTMEFNSVSLNGDFADDEDGLSLSKFDGNLLLTAKPTLRDWKELSNLHKPIATAIEQLNLSLKRKNRHFGYRVANEIARFICLSDEQTDGSIQQVWTAFDHVVLQKVLPKLHGTQQELEDLLKLLFDFAMDLEGPEWSGFRHDWHKWLPDIGAGRLVFKQDSGEQEENPPKPPRLPRTAFKLRRMLERLQERGFTSFIE